MRRKGRAADARGSACVAPGGRSGLDQNLMTVLIQGRVTMVEVYAPRASGALVPHWLVGPARRGRGGGDDAGRQAGGLQGRRNTTAAPRLCAEPTIAHDANEHVWQAGPPPNDWAAAVACKGARGWLLGCRWRFAGCAATEQEAEKKQASTSAIGGLPAHESWRVAACPAQMWLGGTAPLPTAIMRRVHSTCGMNGTVAHLHKLGRATATATATSKQLVGTHAQDIQAQGWGRRCPGAALPSAAFAPAHLRAGDQSAASVRPHPAMCSSVVGAMTGWRTAAEGTGGSWMGAMLLIGNSSTRTAMSKAMVCRL